MYITVWDLINKRNGSKNIWIIVMKKQCQIWGKGMGWTQPTFVEVRFHINKEIQFFLTQLNHHNFLHLFHPNGFPVTTLERGCGGQNSSCLSIFVCVYPLIKLRPQHWLLLLLLLSVRNF